MGIGRVCRWTVEGMFLFIRYCRSVAVHHLPSCFLTKCPTHLRKKIDVLINLNTIVVIFTLVTLRSSIVCQSRRGLLRYLNLNFWEWLEGYFVYKIIHHLYFSIHAETNDWDCPHPVKFIQEVIKRLKYINMIISTYIFWWNNFICWLNYIKI